MKKNLTRRTLLHRASATALGAGLLPQMARSAERPFQGLGYVVGEPTASIVGEAILREGGNAIDAIVAAALAGAIAAPNQTGIGGYGMTAIFAVDSGRKIVAIDGNSTAPAAMQADIFREVAEGKDKNRTNEVGWLAAGVPGILAGLQLAIDRFGTRTFSELVQPAIRLARDGYPWPKQLEATVASQKSLSNDPGSRKLYFKDSKPLKGGDIFRNPDLADLLETLAAANSVAAFYKGDIAQRIADSFQKNGGLVTLHDLASYEAKLVEPLMMAWNGFQVHTSPLTAGGLTVLQILQVLKAMEWEKMSSEIRQLHSKIEATRLAWNDRLTLLGDPSQANVPIDRLLSTAYAEQSAAKITDVVQRGSYLEYPVASKTQGGTINLSALDRDGNMAALTLTHGEAFGAKVSVDGLGLTLGHGMSRFDPRPEHPNAPGPGKRPLHNMVPTVVTLGGQAVMAIGGRGGRKIVNAVLDTVVPFVALGKSLAESIQSPRMHTEGDRKLSVERSLNKEPVQALREIGYDIQTSASATLSAVAIEQEKLQSSMR